MKVLIIIIIMIINNNSSNTTTTIIAALKKCIQTIYFKANIDKTQENGKCHWVEKDIGTIELEQ